MLRTLTKQGRAFYLLGALCSIGFHHSRAIAEAAHATLPFPSGEYEGSVGPKSVFASLEVSQDGSASGTYAYSSIGIPILLRCKKSPKRLVLSESSSGSSNSVSGTFTLEESGPNSLTGTWRSPNGKREFAVKLTRTAELVRSKSQGRNDTTSATITVTAPRFINSSQAVDAINAALERLSSWKDADTESLLSGLDSVQSVRLDEQYLVAYRSDRFVSIRHISRTDETPGEPQLEVTSLLVATDRSTPRTLKMSDVFKDPYSDSIAGLIKEVGAQLSRQRANYIPKSAKHDCHLISETNKSSDRLPFVALHGGLEVYCDSEIPQEAHTPVLVAYPSIAHLLKSDLPLPPK